MVSPSNTSKTDANKEVIVIISTQIWSDNWVSKHWISVLLANQGNKVIFIEPLRGVLVRGGSLRDIFCGPKVKKLNEVNIVSISTLPGYYKTFGVIRKIYKAFMNMQIKKLSRLIGKNFTLLTFDGRSLPFIKRLPKPKKIAYYCVDPVGKGSETNHGESELAHFVDINIAISENCANDMKSALVLNEVSVVPHGMLFEERSSFSDNKNIIFNELENHKKAKKIIGYTGSIHDIYVNYNFILKALEDFQNCHWIFVGPYKGSDIAEDSSNVIKPILGHTNTTFVGNKPVWELSNYIENFDVCLIPYRNDIPNGWERRSPVKILHYLRQGKPIVCANVPGISAYKELIYTYDSYEDFNKVLQTALSEETDNPLRKKRQDFTINREAEVILKELKSLMGVE